METSGSFAPAEVSATARPYKRAGVALGSRGFLLLLLGFAWLAPGLVQPRLLYGILIWDLAVTALWVLDLVRLPRARELQVRRKWCGPAALSVESAVEVGLWNRGRYIIECEVTDDLPPELGVAPAKVTVSAGPGAEGVVHYRIKPARRGVAKVGEIYIRYQSFLRVAERWAVAQLTQSVHIYPDLDEAKRHSIYLIRSRQIELEKRYARIRGLGREFESLREYRRGDEFRDICWTATARRAKLVTKTYQAERSQPVWLVFDSGRLMRARVDDLSKLDHAVNAGLSLAQVALYSGDKVGMLAYGREPRRRVPLGRGSAHFRQIIEELAIVQEESAEADHMRAAATLLGLQQRRSLVVWLTDLAETAVTPEVIEAASVLTKRHLVLFVVIGQPDLASVAEQYPHNVREMFRSTAAQEVLQRRYVLLGGLRNRGALVMESDTRTLSPSLVSHYLQIKERNQL